MICTSRYQSTFRAFCVGVLMVVASCGGGGEGEESPPLPTEPGGGPGWANPPPLVEPPSLPASPVPVGLTEVAKALNNPWGMAFLNDGRLLVTERGGQLKLLRSDGSVDATVSGVPAVVTQGQGGLLDVAVDPDFARNRRIYLSLAEADSVNPTMNGTTVVRAVLDLQARTLRDVTVIFRQTPKVASTAHFGSRLVFDQGGFLFVTLGDRQQSSQRGYAQDVTRGHGKVMRITTDGLAAPGNPTWSQSGAQHEVWSLGHRNVQGAAIHPSTGELWISEHGPQGGDEINRVLPGRNYGWPLVSRGQEYGTTTPVGSASLPGMEDPLWVWETQTGAVWTGGEKSSIAPAGIAFYFGEAVPQWKGSLFVASLAGKALWKLTLAGDRVIAQERLLSDSGERLRDVEFGPDEALYLLTDSGRLLRFGR